MLCRRPRDFIVNDIKQKPYSMKLTGLSPKHNLYLLNHALLNIQ